jgi:hypothetical protein
MSAIWPKLSGDETIEAILSMIDEELRVTANMFRRGGFPDTHSQHYQKIRDMIDGGDWQEFATPKSTPVMDIKGDE